MYSFIRAPKLSKFLLTLLKMGYGKIKLNT